MVPAGFVFLAVSIVVTVWWLWIAPREDRFIIFERGFRWRISWSRWNWFRSEGSVAMNKLEAFSYRSDFFEPGPLESGKTTAEKLTRIWLEVNLSRLDIAFHLGQDKEIVVEKFFARFDPDDLRRFLGHLARFAEPRQITV